ncbi:uncharacterized protein LOC128266035 [Drosophila gunungcola]|uniref:uncharacterized protein LOC128266035 n=1 Tax=Drosophila gunungcola TaxID=103775 RepID=UPI0022E2784D|nr:uncharacterized protein LOC128266035 [Drosophila gunungcola]
MCRETVNASAGTRVRRRRTKQQPDPSKAPDKENPTERTNRTVKTLISQLSEGDQSSWDNMFPEISLAINSSISDSTGYSPAFLTQGREPRLPAMLYDERIFSERLKTRRDFITYKGETLARRAPEIDGGGSPTYPSLNHTTQEPLQIGSTIILPDRAIRYSKRHTAAG